MPVGIAVIVIACASRPCGRRTRSCAYFWQGDRSVDSAYGSPYEGAVGAIGDLRPSGLWFDPDESGSLSKARQSYQTNSLFMTLGAMALSLGPFSPAACQEPHFAPNHLRRIR